MTNHIPSIHSLMIARIVAGHTRQHLINAARLYGIPDLKKFYDQYSEQIVFELLKK